MIQVRRITVDDTDHVLRHRRRMFEDMGQGASRNMQPMLPAFADWVRPRIETSEYVGWFACEDNVVAAGVGLWIIPWPPSLVDPVSRKPYILNVYTEPEFRRRRLARLLMQTAIQWCVDQGMAGVVLHASDEGRPLYELLGFVPTNEMRLSINEAKRDVVRS